MNRPSEHVDHSSQGPYFFDQHGVEIDSDRFLNLGDSAPNDFSGFRVDVLEAVDLFGVQKKSAYQRLDRLARLNSDRTTFESLPAPQKSVSGTAQPEEAQALFDERGRPIPPKVDPLRERASESPIPSIPTLRNEVAFRIAAIVGPRLRQDRASISRPS